MCQARTAAKYFRTTETETGSKGTSIEISEVSVLGSVAAHNANECSSWKDAGRRSVLGIVKISQKR